MAYVVYAEEFSADLELEVAYLHRRHEFGWIRTMMEDLAEFDALIEQFPLAGTELARRDTGTLRRLRLRRAPFSVWHTFDEASGHDGPVTVLRLFHTKRHTLKPHLP